MAKRTKLAGPVKSVEPTTKQTKPRRFRPGTVALREIRKYQKGTGNLAPRQPMQRLIRELANEMSSNARFTPKALEAIQESTEAHLTETFRKANRLAIHADRVTVTPVDIELVATL